MKLEIMKDAEVAEEKKEMLEAGESFENLIGAIAIIAKGIIIPVEKVVIHYQCCKCGAMDDIPLVEGASHTGLCDECNKMENFMKIVGISITK